MGFSPHLVEGWFGFKQRFMKTPSGNTSVFEAPGKKRDENILVNSDFQQYMIEMLENTN